MDSSMKSKYSDMKYDHNDKHLRKSHHHHPHKHHKRRDYSRSRSRSHSRSYSHSRYQKLHHSSSRSRIERDKSHNRNYPNKNYKSDKKEYYKNSQYSSSSHRINNKIYSNTKSIYKKERQKFGMNTSNNIYKDKNREREKEKDERYKIKEYKEYELNKEYKDNKIDNRINLSNYSNSNSNKSKIVINLFQDKKENNSNITNEINININNSININTNNDNIIRNDLNNRQEYLNNINKEQEKDPKNKIYYFITKNDKMKLLFKIYHTFDNINSDINLNSFENNLSFTETRYHKSIRDDLWTFKLNHKYISPSS